MIGILLAGGMGARLRPLTENRPKPLVPILGRPCIDYALELLRKVGIRDVLLTISYRPQHLMRYLMGGTEKDMKLFYSIEDEPLGTAGAVKRVAQLVNDTFVIASGDLLVDADLKDIIDFHKKKGALATIGLTEVPNPQEYGIAALNRVGRITRFVEKPTEREVFSNLINAGIYVMEPDALEMIPDDRPYDFSRDLFPRIMRRKKLYGRLIRGFWLDIGRPADLLEANRIMARKASSEGEDISNLNSLINSGLVHETAEVDGEIRAPVFIGRNASVGAGSSLKYAFIHDSVKIGRNCRIENSIILSGTEIGDLVTVKDSIIGEGSVLKGDSKIEECVLRDGSHVNPGAWLVRQKR